MNSMDSMNSAAANDPKPAPAIPETDVYLAAGTEHGSVYLWKFSSEECSSQFAGVNPFIDDGTRLVSILNSSSRPIVHLSMVFKRETPTNEADNDTASEMGASRARMPRLGSAASVDSRNSSAVSRWRAMYGTPPPARKLLLVAADTSRVVRTYVHIKQVDDSKDNRSGKSGGQTRRAVLDRNKLGSMSSLISFEDAPASRRPFFGAGEGQLQQPQEQEPLEGLMITGESHFDSPVVGCFFAETTYADRPAPPANQTGSIASSVKQVVKPLDRRNLSSSLFDAAERRPSVAFEEEDNKTLDGSRSLVVCLASDEVRFYSTLGLMPGAQSSRAIDQIVAEIVPPAIEINSEEDGMPEAPRPPPARDDAREETERATPPTPVAHPGMSIRASEPSSNDKPREDSIMSPKNSAWNQAAIITVERTAQQQTFVSSSSRSEFNQKSAVSSAVVPPAAREDQSRANMVKRNDESKLTSSGIAQVQPQPPRKEVQEFASKPAVSAPAASMQLRSKLESHRQAHNKSDGRTVNQSSKEQQSVQRSVSPVSRATSAAGAPASGSRSQRRSPSPERTPPGAAAVTAVAPVVSGRFAEATAASAASARPPYRNRSPSGVAASAATPALEAASFIKAKRRLLAQAAPSSDLAEPALNSAKVSKDLMGE
jgi:hypothetical protein